MNNSKTKIICIFFTFVTIIVVLIFFVFNRKGKNINNTTFTATKTIPSQNIMPSSKVLSKDEDNKKQKGKPLIELLGTENLKKEQKQEKVLYHPEKIQDETEKQRRNRLSFIRTEDMGENFSKFTAKKLLTKLQGGNNIEQRKAANALWNKFGCNNKNKLNHKQQQALDKEVLHYLNIKENNFEESYLQLQRLWYLTIPELLKNITNQDTKISEMSARMLSLMKTERIIILLIKDAQKAKAPKDIRKYIFALKYMQYNNPYVIKRPQISKAEAKKLYKKRIVKIIGELEKRKSILAKK